MPPSIEFTKRGGYKDLRQPEDDEIVSGTNSDRFDYDPLFYWKDVGSVRTLINSIGLMADLFYLEDVPVKIGAGGFGDVEKVTYKRPGAPRMAPFLCAT